MIGGKFNNKMDDAEFITPQFKRHNFPDVIFPDGTTMIFDDVLERYVTAPAGYNRTDVFPIPAGDVQMIPNFDTIPTDDQLRREREKIRVQWFSFFSAVSQIVIVISIILAAIGACGYLWQVIRAFGENGAPRIAELAGSALGNIIAGAMYVLAVIVGGLALMSFFSHLRNSGHETLAEYEKQAAQNRGQNININIANGDFNGGNDPAQKIIN